MEILDFSVLRLFRAAGGTILITGHLMTPADIFTDISTTSQVSCFTVRTGSERELCVLFYIITKKPVGPLSRKNLNFRPSFHC